MNATSICLLISAALGLATALGGFGALLTVAAFTAGGLLIGRWLDGEIDLDGLLRSTRRPGDRR
ncbi:hypothetical protein [Nocardia paucivorans]|uniref:hypothetical protein n=1 Tax=Nocardia paucivorans TaxID=114259 RepID=UPI000308BAA8|nr:hypothetical protein [Nocardia paucivorans]